MLRHELGDFAAEVAVARTHLLVPAVGSSRRSGFGFRTRPLWQALRKLRPDLVHVEEEPSSLAMLELLGMKRLLGYRLTFFTWENLRLSFPVPFRWIRSAASRLVDGAIAGTDEAAVVLRSLGFRGRIRVVPQIGVDAEILAATAAARKPGEVFTVGYCGRLVPEKGVDVLLEALAKLGGDWRALIAGEGPEKQRLRLSAQRLGVEAQIRWLGAVSPTQVPEHLAMMHVLVLPSRSARRWQEQFGRVLIEAMACGVPVVGASSGAIPSVIGDAGLLFPENDAAALAVALERLRGDSQLRSDLAQRGSERASSCFTNRQIAERTVAFWREVLEMRIGVTP
jgi:glycosyltransferase involved in cell wall biosynthesis